MTVNILGGEGAHRLHAPARGRRETQGMRRLLWITSWANGTARSGDAPMNMRDQAAVNKRILRHERIHAFAEESGLAHDSEWR